MHATIEQGFEKILRYGITAVEIIGAVIVFFYTFRLCIICFAMITPATIIC